MIIDVYYRTFDSLSLLESKTTYSHMMSNSLFGIMWIKKSVDCILLEKYYYSEIILSYKFIKMKLNKNKASDSFDFQCQCCVKYSFLHFL